MNYFKPRPITIKNGSLKIAKQGDSLVINVNGRYWRVLRDSDTEVACMFPNGIIENCPRSVLSASFEDSCNV